MLVCSSFHDGTGVDLFFVVPRQGEAASTCTCGKCMKSMYKNALIRLL